MLRATVADLYFRWFSNASFGKQAKTLWKSKKEGFFARFAAKTVDVASDLVEAVPLVGGAAKPFLKGGKTLFAPLADADANLRGANLQQDLTYDQVLATVSMLAEVTECWVVLVLDGFDQIPDPGRQLGVLSGFLSNTESWPHTHMLAAIRQNVTGEPAGEVAALCSLHSIAHERVVGGMALRGAEGARLVSYLTEHIPVTRELRAADLVGITDAYPAIVGRWLDRRDDISSMADLEKEARNAKQNLHPEFERFREMPPVQQRLGMRLAVLRQLSGRDDWEVFRPIILGGLGEADIAHLQARGLLELRDYPTYGHATRHRGALDWFSRALPAPLAEETDILIRATGAAARNVDDASLPFLLALHAMMFHLSGSTLSKTAMEVLGAALCMTADGLGNKALRDMVGTSARRCASAWPDCAALLSVALFNVLDRAQSEEDLPRRAVARAAQAEERPSC